MKTANPLGQAWMKIGVFDTLTPARALCGFLKKEGFDARLHDERQLQRFWFFARPRAGIGVEVPEATWSTAKIRLETGSDGKLLLRKAIRCPSCQSLRVQYPQMTRKNMLPTLVAHALVAVRLMRHECYCEDCHNTWVPGGRKYTNTPKHVQAQ